MQQKESFLKTKKGKIVVGSVTGSIVLLLSILLLCWYKEVWPFGPKITETNVKDLTNDLNGTKTAAEKHDVLEKFITDKVNKVNKKLDDANEGTKKIGFDQINEVKNQLAALKAKTTAITPEDTTKLQTAVTALDTYLKAAIAVINK
ncbi:hypothetical protein CWO85_00565 [Candidatus Phytoplasma ziziphi]|uniref:Immunodominant membrane protein n=1 Tax=Ziziphus jujuba witches'-broom phytoplasma TaxID=135727 RepID=A0A660HLV1_ZIZJU|nr:hypothetical protein [Candidatus Phytoplasma ziziphi]AYJ01033.1 hypothetical protein CWO85_00565 [Candidatus Phytoplasma ziziphi]